MSDIVATHHIGVLMSGAGRFLGCMQCNLFFDYPSGAHYDTVVKQFEGRHCTLQNPCSVEASPGSGVHVMNSGVTH